MKAKILSIAALIALCLPTLAEAGPIRAVLGKAIGGARRVSSAAAKPVRRVGGCLFGSCGG